MLKCSFIFLKLVRSLQVEIINRHMIVCKPRPPAALVSYLLLSSQRAKPFKAKAWGQFLAVFDLIHRPPRAQPRRAPTSNLGSLRPGDARLPAELTTRITPQTADAEMPATRYEYTSLNRFLAERGCVEMRPRRPARARAGHGPPPSPLILRSHVVDPSRY
ncbi:hypothetical protein EVAR_71242_1 [Eumeta japonica]|uniref:Uncharacterized protein n=1 Tax=Eumeta variegata TaxID=151549 RepID=A0A4C1SDL8_EUMVA|nr:hypothetical protein EVAR_71242_1 [Eumeta japonica]